MVCIRIHGGPSPVPIVRLDGAFVASGTADFWDGPILNRIILTELNTSNGTSVWTGAHPDGTQYGGIWFMGSPLPGVGVSFLTDDRWVSYTRADPAESRPLYGISGTLYAPDGIPEPSAAYSTIGGLLALYCMRRQAILKLDEKRRGPAH